MRGIFISYRREDAEGQAGRLFDDLTAHFGRDAVFMDVAGIKKGLDFRRIIDEHVTSCGVLLVIIGKRWLSVTDGKGKRRLDDANDFVRLETAAALSRDIPVVPVLVQDAVMPTEQDLPDVLKNLAFRNGTELTHARWDSDVKLLIEDLRPYLETPEPAALAPKPATVRPMPPGSGRLTSRALWAAAGTAVVTGGVSIFGYHVWQDRLAAQERALAAVQAPPKIAMAQRTRDSTAATPPVVSKPALKVAEEPRKLDATPTQTEASKAAAEKAAADKAAADKAVADKAAADKAAADKAAAEKAAAARAAAARNAAARKEADERLKREEAERSAQLAEEQRKRNEEARQIALAQAEKNRIAAEQAAAAQVFRDIATAVIGSRQNNRR
jgi:flagellar biosynthesis GTPase FlhF